MSMGGGGGGAFFSFCQSKLLSHFVPISPDTCTKREIPRIKFNGCLVDLNNDLDTRRISKYFEH